MVVSSDVNKGGTWAGAIEQLERFKNCAVYVRTNAASKGNEELQNRGALPWPLPKTIDEFKRALETASQNSEAFTADLPLFAMEQH